MNKKYVWVNPVALSLYKFEYLKNALFQKEFFIVFPKRDNLSLVRKKYFSKCSKDGKCIMDMRCPKVFEYIMENGLKGDIEYPKINPILIETALELNSMEDFKDGNIYITTPCESLAYFGNSLNMERTEFLTWKKFVKENKIELNESLKNDLKESPIPPGFFKGIKNVCSITGAENITKIFENKLWKNNRIIEALYCEGGCHNGDGII